MNGFSNSNMFPAVVNHLTERVTINNTVHGYECAAKPIKAWIEHVAGAVPIYISENNGLGAANQPGWWVYPGTLHEWIFSDDALGLYVHEPNAGTATYQVRFLVARELDNTVNGVELSTTIGETPYVALAAGVATPGVGAT